VSFGARTGFWRDNARPLARPARYMPESPEWALPPLPQVGRGLSGHPFHRAHEPQARRDEAPPAAVEAGARGEGLVVRGQAIVEDHVPPPGAFDVLRAAAAYRWPRIALVDGRILEGEASWRAAVGKADPAGRLAIWQALQARARC
jgi:hypothetical protein